MSFGETEGAQRGHPTMGLTLGTHGRVMHPTLGLGVILSLLAPEALRARPHPGWSLEDWGALPGVSTSLLREVGTSGGQQPSALSREMVRRLPRLGDQIHALLHCVRGDPAARSPDLPRLLAGRGLWAQVRPAQPCLGQERSAGGREWRGGMSTPEGGTARALPALASGQLCHLSAKGAAALSHQRRVHCCLARSSAAAP